MAGVGCKTEVKGMRMAIVEVGPNPGSTPTSVPTKAPTKAIEIFMGLKAEWNPFIRWEKVSKSRTSLSHT
jgi:hypothetical protein